MCSAYVTTLVTDALHPMSVVGSSRDKRFRIHFLYYATFELNLNFFDHITDMNKGRISSISRDLIKTSLLQYEVYFIILVSCQIKQTLI